MKNIILTILIFSTVVLTTNGQTVDVGYLNPMHGTGAPYKYVRFGTPDEYYAGFMWNNTQPTYGDGDDFTIFTYGGRDINIQSVNGNFIVFPSSGGNMGIGTTNPQAKLAVNGNILAKEIKIKTDISVPDYVFEADYKLPTLAAVEAFIKEHKHLPEIPSAAEIENSGLDVAQMNLLLLKKVEELTLHLIEKDRELIDMREQMAEMKTMESRVQQLENIVKTLK